MEDFQEQLKRWRALERAALDLEQQVRGAGRLGASPEAAALLREAAARRRAADQYLTDILGPGGAAAVPPEPGK